ncbi:DNA internalization-related competence protein ComEC/Rec2 [Robbsia sp. KACC 23696]|uniref:DNA internalization-related competence protein ComEC/Rec2 n=1 Tax=Robbsia sp. KACC 23696 TaxID=3149231 RepID=UPI00325B637D
MRSIALGFAGGAWWLQRQATLPDTAVMAWLAFGCVALLIARTAAASLCFSFPGFFSTDTYRRTALAALRCGLLCLAAAMAGYDWAGWRAHQYAQAVWPAAWEGRDVALTGRIESMPIRVKALESPPGRGGTRARGSADWLLTVQVLAVRPVEARLGKAARNGGGANGGPRADVAAKTGAAAGLAREPGVLRFTGRVQVRLRGTGATLAPQPGEVWRMQARLQRPHGLANFDLPMREASLFQRGVRATGAARSAVRVGVDAGGALGRLRAAVERLRSRIASRIDAVLDGQVHRGVVAALALGLQSAITPEDWTRFTRTGTNHLVAVSGLHIGLAAAVAAWCAAATLRWAGAGVRYAHRALGGRARRGCRAPPLLLIVPRQRIVSVVAMAAAGSFVALSGFGIPAQRAFWMLSAYCLTALDGRRVGVTVIWCLALWLVVLADPWAVQSAGGWLSFAAIGAILYIASTMPQRIRPPRSNEHGAADANSDRHPSDAFAARFTMPVRPGEWRPLADGKAPSHDGLERSAKAKAKAGAGREAFWDKVVTARARAGAVTMMRRIGLACRLQWALSLALAPASLVWFGETALVGPAANLFAIPWVSVVVVPAVFLGLILPAPFDAPAWRFAHGAIGYLHQALGHVSDGAAHVLGYVGVSDMFRVPLPGMVALSCCCVGLALGLAPRTGYARRASRWGRQGLAVALCLPIVLYRPSAPALGDFRVTMFDIGQGNGVLIETRSRRLLYDTGPPYGPSDDAGRRVIVPALRRRGIEALDAVIISHPHDDHYGGVFAVLDAVSVRHLLASWPSEDSAPAASGQGKGAALPPLWRHAGAQGVLRRRCRAGEAWQWDGVRFETLWPIDPALRAPPNHTSCVLRISNGRHAVLLAGDIEAPQEAALLRAGTTLSADVLLAPHHGSATSSTPAFIDAVAPRHVVFQVGYRNRHRHPTARVVPRYDERGVATYRSDSDGAVRFDSVGATLKVEALRRDHRRYWMIAPTASTASTATSAPPRPVPQPVVAAG